MVRRRHTSQQRQERISRKQFEEFLEQHEWITDSIDPDMGEDIHVRIYDKGVSTGISFYVQLKSTSDIEKFLTKTGFISYPLKVKDLEHWEFQAIPVLLVLWDISQRKGWWIQISDAISEVSLRKEKWRTIDPSKKLRIRIPFENELTESSLPCIRHNLAEYFYPSVAKDKDLVINVKLAFPKTEEGMEKYAQFQKLHSTGDKVELEKSHIVEFSVSEWWTRLYGELDVDYLVMESSPDPISRPIQIEFWSPKHGSEVLPYIEMKLEKQGTDEFTISNFHQGNPHKIKMIVNKITKKVDFKYSSMFCGDSCDIALRSLKIQRIINTGGELRMTSLDNEKTEIYPIPVGQISDDHGKLIEFVEKVCRIQELFGVDLTYPEDCNIKFEDLAVADELISIYENGKHTSSNMEFKGEFYKPAIEMMVDLLRKQLPFRMSANYGESYVELFSTRFELGPMTRYMTGKWEKPLKDVEKWLEESSDENSMEVIIPGAEVLEVFENLPAQND